MYLRKVFWIQFNENFTRRFSIFPTLYQKKKHLSRNENFKNLFVHVLMFKFECFSHRLKFPMQSFIYIQRDALSSTIFGDMWKFIFYASSKEQEEEKKIQCKSFKSYWKRSESLLSIFFFLACFCICLCEVFATHFQTSFFSQKAYLFVRRLSESYFRISSICIFSTFLQNAIIIYVEHFWQKFYISLVKHRRKCWTTLNNESHKCISWRQKIFTSENLISKIDAI